MTSIEYYPAPGQPDFTAETFLRTLSRSNSIWWSGTDKSLQWIFRGHRDSSWKLLPVAHRPKGHGNKLWRLIDVLRKLPLIPITLTDFDLQEFNVHSLTQANAIFAWCSAELEALHQFCELANTLGLPVQIPTYSSPLKIGQLHTTVVSHRLPSDMLALAQHHGIPTRLLDWTDDPIIATFHAANSTTTSFAPNELAVWALSKQNLPQYTFDNGKRKHTYDPITFVNPARHMNPFLMAQRGVLTDVYFANRYYLEYGQWPDLETVFANAKAASPSLRKFVLKSSHIPELKILLRREGYSTARIMPSLDNVASEVIGSWD